MNSLQFLSLLGTIIAGVAYLVWRLRALDDRLHNNLKPELERELKRLRLDLWEIAAGLMQGQSRERAEPGVFHHPIFSLFPPFKGPAEPGFDVDFLGVRTRRDRAGDMRIPAAAAGMYPSVSEEYFEWIDLLEAVAAANGPFTMVELGAGNGPWLVRAGVALRRLERKEFKLVGVEAEPVHFRWMGEHFLDNGLRPDQHWLIEAMVSTKEGKGHFFVGRSADWYGQRALTNDEIAAIPQQSGEKRLYGDTVSEVASVTLNSILEKAGRVDLLDADIQGAELEVLEAAKDKLNAQVKRIHIGTHNAEVEAGLRRVFSALGWEKINDFACGSVSLTKWGLVRFGDGVQTWINPHLD